MNRLRLGLCVLRYLGPRIVWLRSRVILRDLLGLTRRTYRPRPWTEIDLAQLFRPGVPSDAERYRHWKLNSKPAFLFPLGQPPPDLTNFAGQNAGRQPDFDDRLRLLRSDRCVYFFNQPSPESINWHHNPIDDRHGDGSSPWYEIPDYREDQGDPRMLWEPARAAWAIDCAKASAYGHTEEAARLFWRWFDSWSSACPPFTGFQWKCGQESAVRFVALSLAFWATGSDPSVGPNHFVQFARAAWATGHRIQHHISYAVSQKNNHAFSEASALMLIARLFPEFHEASKWRDLGRQILQQEISRQIYDDGSYVQHSMNYQRVALQMAVLGMRLSELDDSPFPRPLYERIGKASLFLFQMMDQQNGRLPSYGHNDGAYVLPLSECDFLDFRPAIQAGHFLATRERLLAPGPWDEDLLWLFGDEARDSDSLNEHEARSCAFEIGGYYTLRADNSWAMTRCHKYVDRPGQCDQLHVDLWWKGQNVLRDCGTYRYYVPGRPDVEFYFKSIRAHNSVEIDNRNPLELASRFLWFPWPRCRQRRFQPVRNGTGLVEMESHDYQRKPVGCLHRRSLLSLANDVWIVIDDLLGQGEHHAVLRWHFLDVPIEINEQASTVHLNTSAGRFGVSVVCRPPLLKRLEMVRGRDQLNEVQGFASDYYGQRTAVPTLEASFQGPFPARILSTFCPNNATVPRRVTHDTNSETWALDDEGRRTLTLAPPSRSATEVFLSARCHENPESQWPPIAALG